MIVDHRPSSRSSGLLRGEPSGRSEDAPENLATALATTPLARMPAGSLVEPNIVVDRRPDLEIHVTGWVSVPTRIEVGDGRPV